MIDDNAYIVHIEVDESDFLNQSPIQSLEPAEDIRVCLVTKEEARDFFLKEFAEETHISSNLWYVFGLGDLFFK